MARGALQVHMGSILQNLLSAFSNYLSLIPLFCLNTFVLSIFEWSLKTGFTVFDLENNTAKSG